MMEFTCTSTFSLIILTFQTHHIITTETPNLRSQPRIMYHIFKIKEILTSFNE